MNYPVWQVFTLGGGSLIALISVPHVYIAHLAVGGGLFIWLTDLKGFRENNPLIHQYLRRHTWFFLLLTMVFGGVSGVGIWFVISVENPAATSTLIHYFVFGWAIEWVFFLGEIVALLIYHYKFDTLDKRPRLTLAFLYFLFAWLSLVAINGIISFMLTPGKWLQTHSFWDGFLNPTCIPSMFFRTMMAFMIAGLFGYITSSFIKERNFRTTMMRYCTKWLLCPLPGLIATGIWYYLALPSTQRHLAFSVNPEMRLFVLLLIALTLVIFLLALVLAFRFPVAAQRVLGFLVVGIGLLWMGAFEYSREIARKPYVINGFMYSNMIKKPEIRDINRHGFLSKARWAKIKKVNQDNKLQAGHELIDFQCISCHTVRGPHNDILRHTRPFTELGIISLLTGQGKVRPYMPPFAGNNIEKQALAAYIARDLNRKKQIHELIKSRSNIPKEVIPPFNEKTAKYVILAWNDLGMHCVSDGDPWFVILPPGNTLEAILIERGESPSLITEGVELTYKVDTGYQNPSAHVDFWKYAKANFGRNLKKNFGLKGNGLAGKFRYDDDRNSFVAEGIPVLPYKDDGTYNPYPLFTVEARDAETGELLARTKVVAPVSTEVGCRNCHEGGWRFKNMAGIDAATSTNILAVHDRLERTHLLKEAKEHRPRACQSCHGDPALGMAGKPSVLNLSAAIHGWHANYIPYDDARACVLCHPANKKGNTQCARGFHALKKMTCTDCHGMMQEHAAALLKAENAKPRSKILLAHLRPTHVRSIGEIAPRLPWIQEPDCLTCHEGFEKPKNHPSAFNVWNSKFSELYRMRTAEGDIRCEACHGATHALYPAKNPYSKDRDNIQPLQYSGLPFPIGSNLTCKVCHTVSMEDAIHHENMEHEFRNSELVLGKRQP